MKRKHAYLIILILLILLVADLSIIRIINPVKYEGARGNANKGPLADLADTTENIHLDLLFNNIKLQNSQELVGKIQYLWGPYANQPINPSIYTSAYVPLDWPAFIRNNFNWWIANHPDWIVYKCDKKTPAFVDPTQPDAIPYDISNPAVRDFQLKTYVIPFLQKKNNSIGFDNMVLDNYTGKCGIWRNGVWHQLYSGNYHDTVYANEVVDWAKEMYTRIHQYSPAAGVASNMNILNSPASYQRLAPYTDIILDEGGLTNFGIAGKNYITNSSWLIQIRTIQQIIKLGKGFVLNAYEPETSYRDISNQEVQWDLSNYLLIKGSHTFTYVSVNQSSQERKTFSDRLEYHINIGHPVTDMYDSQGVYMRSYSNGLVIVNPSDNMSYYLNFTRPYLDVQDNTITSYVIGVHSGLILLNKA